MQQMIYDNYSHFIDASNVVKNIVPDLEKMKSKILAMKQSISREKAASDSLTQAIQGIKPELTSVLKKQKLIEEINKIVALPVQMKANLVKDNFMDTIRYFLNFFNIYFFIVNI